MKNITESDIARFKAFIDDSGSCWKWTGRKSNWGYGQFWHAGTTKSAHRLAYEMFVGQIENGKCVCHSCDTPECVNPAHLWIGSVADNNKDKAIKGRAPRMFGSKNGRYKNGEHCK